MKNHTSYQPSFLNWLASELSTRMREKLSLVKISPTTILDYVDFSEDSFRALHESFPKAHLVAQPGFSRTIIDVVQNLFGRGMPKHDSLPPNPDIIPLSEGVIDLLWASAWQFAHNQEWQITLHEWRRVMKVGGLLMFSYLGPDTAQELRKTELLSGVLGVDMHDMGDALSKAYFSDPVMDMEFLTLTYESPSVFYEDLQALNLLKPEVTLSSFSQSIEVIKGEDGIWRMTLEVVYGHSWAFEARPKGVATIRPEDIKIKSK